MKKALTTLSIIGSSIGYTFAQVQVTVGQVAQQGNINGGALINLLGLAQTIVTRLVPFAIGVAVLAFFWFLINFIMKGDSADEKSKALKGMGYSILALFVMVSIWGIIGFLGSMFGIGQGGSVPIPGVPVPSN